MNSLVKNVFLMIMGTTVALILYFVFFGQAGNWEGLLWFATRQFEVPCAMHYYEYCYLPNARQSDGVDSALGGTIQYTNLQATPSDLSNTATDLVYFSPTVMGSNVEAYWSTSWY